MKPEQQQPLFLRSTIITLLLCAATASAAPVNLFVAPDGKDTNPGTQPAPFATLERARDEARRLRGSTQPPPAVTVQVRGGLMFLKQPFRLESKDSGSPGSPVVYMAFPGERPVLSGGRLISSWKKGRGDLWQTEIPEVKQGGWYFHQLFVNDQRRQPARSPNEGWLRTTGSVLPYTKATPPPPGANLRNQFKFKAGDLEPAWHNLSDVRLFLYHSWTASMHWIDEINETSLVVRLTNPSGWPLSWWEREQRYHVENLREALDTPGEWYLDRQTGVLEYFPKPGEDMTSAQAIAPVLMQLVLIEGSWEQQQWVRNVTLRGLSFQHADWSFPDKTQTVDGQGAVTLTGAIHANAASHLILDQCEIAHVGGYALALEAACQSNRVVQCHLHDFAGGGIRIGEFMRQKTKAKDFSVTGQAVRELTLEGDGPRDTGHNLVDNNFIHDGGHVFPGAVGVILSHSAYNQVSHNEICDLFYSGVSLGWVWGFGQSAAHHNRITDNHIHHLGWGVMSDMGGVYSLGPSPGTVVAHNYIHHVNPYSYGGWGLYTDEGSSDMILEDNLVHDTKTGGFHQHYGANNVIRNNIFAFSREAQIQRSREDVRCHIIFERNLLFCDNDQMLIRAMRNGDYKLDANVYWTTTKADALFDGRTWDEWRATSSQDQHSLFADPLFVNAAARDFRLATNSPAFKVGFKPFPLDGFGLQGDKSWKELPAKVTRPEFNLPPTKAPTPTGASDDFENTRVGDRPNDATINGETGMARIVVTDEQAATGARSLKFTDAPGLEHNFDPIMQYRPVIRRGIAHGTFAIRLGKDAIFSHEWRDAAKPYKRGPSIRLTDRGVLQAANRDLMPIPLDTWITLKIVCGLGDKADGTYDLTVTVRGQPPRTFEDLPTGSKDFKVLQWYGFIAFAEKDAQFYVDDVKLEAKEP